MQIQQNFNRVFVTGDIHADVSDLAERVNSIDKSTKDDLLIILGDCAFFHTVFYGRPKIDSTRRNFAANLPITILCVQGNHEQPFCEMDAKKISLLGGEGYYADGLFFAANGTTLNLCGKKALVVGGASSIDKRWRQAKGNAWWQNEELSEEELKLIYKNTKNKEFDFVLSHTCPYEFLPTEVFLYGIDQKTVSQRTEHYLQKIHDSIQFKSWFCGHFHTDKQDGKIEFFYQSVKQII